MTLSLDMTALFDNASVIINALWGIAAVGIGFTLAFGIIGYITRAVAGVVGKG